MLSISVQQALKRFGLALVVPLSLYLTLAALLEFPSAQAHQHVAPLPFVPGDVVFVPTAPSGGVDVSISGFAFNPSVITITAGTVVTWTNLDSFAHTTTSDVGSLAPWDSGSLSQGGIFTKTFNTPGAYNYHCNFHDMHGTVVVLPQPPTEVNVTGPSEGTTVLAQTFTAAVDPITTTQPITYIWEATGQTTVTRTDKGLSDTLAFTWPTLNVGPQMITVTAANDVGSVSATHAITLVPPSNVYLPLVLR